MGGIKMKVGMAFLLYCSAAIYAAHTHAITMSQQPLFLVSGAEPNLMFVLDDSGSMLFEIMPETYRVSDVLNVFPSNGITNFNSRVAAPGEWTIDGVAAVNGKLLRSKLNTIYYDPGKLYTPWVSTDGVTSMPNASPTCAYHNPMVTGTGESKCRNLTVAEDRTFNSVGSTWYACSGTGTCKTSTSSSISLYPATYYWFTGTASQAWDGTKYELVEIKSTTATYTGHGRDSGKRTDCSVASGGVTTCTYEQEIQNFANWYTYYRSRILTARAGIGRAFAVQQDNMRVGFGAINRASTTIDGVSTPIIKTGVRKFDSTRKQGFLDELYSVAMSGSTPLPNALYHVGKYFERTDNKGPWGKNPGVDDATAHVECRASYALLMSDGFWNSGITGVGNSDNTAGSLITNHTAGGTPATYQYSPSAPYADNQSNTLADVAMEFWKKDLRSTLNNRVKPNTLDPAFWQHMTTFTIGLGVAGDISPVPDVATAITSGATIAWPVITTSAENGTKVDDMIHAAINGRGGFFSAADPDEFTERLSNMLSDITDRENNNAAAAAANSTSLNTGSTIYTALFDSGRWSGRLEATRIGVDGKIESTPMWTSSIDPAPSNRKIFTFNGSTGVEFLWANLTTAQKNYLKEGGTDAVGESRLNWIRGTDSSGLRDREDGHFIGDIVNSDPVYAGNNDQRFDRLPAALGGDQYKAYYETSKKNRREMIYVGANDGMLHGFNARVASPDTIPAGKEVFAYIPTQGFSKFADLSASNYGKDNTNTHQYFVDGPAYVTDAFLKGAWRTILVGSLGGGGRGIYVLDISDPENFSADDVLFELTEAQYPQLGYITGRPILAPAKDNRWKIFLGNGYNSTQGGSAKAYLGVIDVEDEWNRIASGSGTTRTVFLTTDGVSESALAQPALLPDPDGYIVAAYAGDMRGNLWKFDLSGATPGTWAAAFGTTPLFVASRSGVRQPITASPTLGFNPELTPARVMVYFGTGSYVAANDNQPSSAIQSFYAIADKNAAIPVASGRSTLHQKAIASSSTAERRYIDYEVTTGLTNAVNWSAVDGWYMDFPANERIVTKPLLLYDRLIFPTIIPSEDACESGGSGWLMELIAVGNTKLDYKLLGDNGNIALDVAIFGQLTSLEGTYQPTSTSSTSSSSGFGSSSSASNDCAASGSGKSGTVAVVGIQSDGTNLSNTGGRPCELFNRQSWRELE